MCASTKLLRVLIHRFFTSPGAYAGERAYS